LSIKTLQDASEETYLESILYLLQKIPEIETEKDQEDKYIPGDGVVDFCVVLSVKI
jgi:hypothetical protein